MSVTGHLLDPEHAPTPFTAAQIRAASPDGRTVETRTLRDGRVTALGVTVFVDGDEHEVTLRARTLDPDGTVLEEAAHRVAWLDLQRHASFPDADTAIGEERLATPLGELECLRYRVSRDGRVDTFWFSVDHPGMPVRHEAGPDDSRVTVEVTAYRAAR